MKKKPVIISLALTAAALLAGRAFDGEREMIIGAFSSLHAAAAAGRSPLARLFPRRVAFAGGTARRGRLPAF